VTSQRGRPCTFGQWKIAATCPFGQWAARPGKKVRRYVAAGATGNGTRPTQMAYKGSGVAAELSAVRYGLERRLLVRVRL
jgi:hypothetical protein